MNNDEQGGLPSKPVEPVLVGAYFAAIPVWTLGLVFFLIRISIPVGIRMDRPAGCLLHKYLRDPYYLNPVKTRRRNRESPL